MTIYKVTSMTIKNVKMKALLNKITFATPFCVLNAKFWTDNNLNVITNLLKTYYDATFYQR